MFIFACISPHPPIILPDIGSPSDRQKVDKTITALESLAPKLAEAKPEIVIISSPHPDWGINVPAHFLLANLQFSIYNFHSILNAENFKFNNLDFNENLKPASPAGGLKIKNSTLVLPILTTLNTPRQHFEFGRQIANQIPNTTRVAWIASGDMSHRLKEDGPYGFHPSGPKFDQKFIKLLKDKDIERILNLNPDFTEEAGECGLRSFCMLLGALVAQGSPWQGEVLSYEGPFGVGYLVANFKIEEN